MRRTGLMLYIYPIGKFYIGRHKSSKKSHKIPIRHRLHHKLLELLTNDQKSRSVMCSRQNNFSHFLAWNNGCMGAKIPQPGYLGPHPDIYYLDYKNILNWQNCCQRFRKAEVFLFLFSEI